MERFQNSYQLMKDRYLDLLTANDIQNILNKDAEHTANVAYLKEKRNSYLLLWIGVLAVIFSVTTALHLLYLHDTCPALLNALFNLIKLAL